MFKKSMFLVFMTVLMVPTAMGAVEFTDQPLQPEVFEIPVPKAHPEAACFGQIQLRGSQFFSTRRGAQNWCNQFQRNGFGNHCRVDVWDDGRIFQGRFNFVGRARGSSFFQAQNAIVNFLVQFNLILDQLQQIFDFFGLESADSSCL